MFAEFISVLDFKSFKAETILLLIYISLMVPLIGSCI